MIHNGRNKVQESLDHHLVVNDKMDGRAIFFGYNNKTAARNGKADVVERRGGILLKRDPGVLGGKADGCLQVGVILLVGIRDVRLNKEIRQRQA